MKIGNVSLKNEYILAPMAGFTDLPFRLICSKMGAGMVCMEMISAMAITYKNIKTFEMLKIHPDETTVSLQLFGKDPLVLGEAAKMIDEYPFDILDVNMGCPVKKIVENGEGSALMKDPVLAGQIIEALVKATKKPVTVKIRAGFDEAHINAVEMAHVAKESGAAGVAVHGRTRNQFYEGKADWEIIQKVKESVDIPVMGSGDVTDIESARRMKEETGADGIMIGRAARGNPWIFKTLSEGKEYKPTVEEISKMILDHTDLLVIAKDEYRALREMRAHAAFYTAGMPNSAAFRREINQTKTMDEFVRKVMELNELH
ncbi:MAG: tRNA dihydrouridine synthase DusB [Lachnospiraceae bacterium]|nr:tRNA dihydrouridine synthase DusB [Lachnospiraceae bacterium]